MTLFRMRQVHHLPLPDEVHDAIVRQLADTQGLAPVEARRDASHSSAARTPRTSTSAPSSAVCGRCHSLARVALQRRDSDEWLKHMHFHVGQFPTLEYQASGRDRPWWQIASTSCPRSSASVFRTRQRVDRLAEAPERDLAGRWIVVGHVPGGRDFYGSADIRRDGDGAARATHSPKRRRRVDRRRVARDRLHRLRVARPRDAWGGRRARSLRRDRGRQPHRAGRWFDPDHTELGGEWTAIRADGSPEVLAVLPRRTRRGARRVSSSSAPASRRRPPPASSAPASP